MPTDTSKDRWLVLSSLNSVVWVPASKNSWVVPKISDAEGGKASVVQVEQWGLCGPGKACDLCMNGPMESTWTSGIQVSQHKSVLSK